MTETRILAVDDEIVNLEILAEYFSDEEKLSIETMSDSEAAWMALQDDNQRYDLILLDRMMPKLDGIGLLKRIKGDRRLAEIPVIMQTAASAPNQVREGLEAGAYYYLTKPYRRDDLLAIVYAALSDAQNRTALHQQLTSQVQALRYLDHAVFSIRSIDEASELAALVARACPNPDMAVIGLSELLINGIEHGNLGLSYEEKSRLKREDAWQSEIARRAAMPEHADKCVRLEYQRTPQDITLRISDQGQGFDWQNFLEIDPERAFDPNGRGIALARMLSFSSIHYEGCGNVAVARIERTPTKDA